MVNSAKPIRIPAPISKKLKEVGSEKKKCRLATWFIGGLALLLLAMSFAMYIDWTLTLFNPVWRGVLTFATLATVAASQFAWWMACYSRGCKPAELASEVDSALPQLEERWTTIAEIAASPEEHHKQINRAMMDRLSREATSLESHVHAKDVTSARSLVIAWGILCSMLLILALALTFDWQQTSVLIRRFWMPTANISATLIAEQTGDVVVGRGESFTLTAKLESHLVPEAMLFIKGENGQPQRITLYVEGDEGDRLTYRVKAADESFDYRIRAGDGQTDWHLVTVVERPELAGVRFSVIPPAYTKQKIIELKELPHKVNIVEGSSVIIALRPRGDETKVVLRMTKARQPNSEKQLTREYTLKPDENGWFHYRLSPQESLTLSPLLRESHGLENRRPPLCKINVYCDQPPVVSILTPDDNMAIRADDKIDVNFQAQDDIAVSKAELVVYETDPRTGKPVELDVIEIPLEDRKDNRKVQGSVAIDLAKYDLKDGDELDYAVRVYDNHKATGSSKAKATMPNSQTERAVAATPLDTRKDPERGESASDKSSSHKSTQSPSRQSPTESELAKRPLVDQNTARNRDMAQADPAQTDLAQSDTAKTDTDSTKSSKTDTSKAAMVSQSTPQAASPSASQSSAASKPNAKQGDKPLASRVAQSPRQDSAESKPDAKGNKASAANSASQSPRQTSSTAKASKKNKTSEANNKLAQGENTKKQEENPSNENRQSNPQGSRLAASSKPLKPSEKGKLTGAPTPHDKMSKRMLDIGGQCTCSGKKRIHIDRWAGSYKGLQREKLEIAIAPELQNLDEMLAKAENYSRQTLDRLEQKMKWTGQQDRYLNAATKILRSIKKNVSNLRSKTADTPYAFIGLQLSEIVQSHVAPASESLWSALNADADPVRHKHTQAGWQQIARARQRLRQLTQQFERISREHRLADKMMHIKTMYRVFLENSFITLKPKKSAINKYERSLVQFELDEEFMQRLQEVLEMQRDLEAELSRILADDPRLLRRLTERIERHTESLRDQLTLQAQRQQQIDRELRALISVAPAERESLKVALVRLKLAEAGKIASSAAELHERFVIWLPLDLELKDGPLADVRDLAAGIAIDTRALQDAVTSYDNVKTDKDALKNDLASFARLGRAAHDKLRRLDVQLRRLSAQQNHKDLSKHTIRRLVEVSRLITRTSAWVAKIEHIAADKFHRAVEVDQYTLTTDTNQLIADLADIEQNMAAILGRSDGKLPTEFAHKARELLSTLDDQIAPNQLTMCYALDQNKLPKAAKRGKAAVAAFAQAERIFDELMRMIIDEIDRRPVSNPIASNLKDPTLDKLLAMLEDERDCRAALGIPCCRPSNLQIVKDWLLPGNMSGSGGTGTGGTGTGGSGSTGSSSNTGKLTDSKNKENKQNKKIAENKETGQRDAMMRAYLRHQQQRADELTRRASARAIARALKESGYLSDAAMRQLTKQATGTDWNVLVSKLEDELLQGRGQLPPQAYRRAIEQYFDEISRTNTKQNAK